MKITVFALGGTIGSEVDESGVIRLGEAARDLFASPDFKFLSPFAYSSEDADIYTYQKALKAVYSECIEDKPDGVIILHGTDTMAYFAQVAYRVLRVLDIPVVITGSVLPPSVPGSDAKANVQAAIDYISSGVPGVAVTGKGIAGALPAYKITQADLSGKYGVYESAKAPDVRPEFLAKEFLPDVMVIPDVPGAFAKASLFEKHDCILIRAYHSGTCPAALADALPKGTKAFIAPVMRSDTVYESRHKAEQAGIIPLYDMPFEGAWAEVMVNE